MVARRIGTMRDGAVKATNSASGNKTSQKQRRIIKRAEEQLRSLFGNITLGSLGAPTLANKAPPLDA